jgi:hypothetical protein
MAESVVQESWNMATETLKRLARCMDMCSFYSQQGELTLWFNASMDWRRNLKPFLEPKEFTDLDTKFKTLPQGWCIQGRVLPQHRGNVYVILDEIYMMMSTHMKEKGLLMPKTKDPRAAVLDM